MRALFLVLIITSAYKLSAQNDFELPANKWKTSDKHSKREIKNLNDGIEFLISLGQTTFLNPSFSQSINNNELDVNPTLGLGGSSVIHPFIIHTTWNYNKINIKNDNWTFDDRLRHHVLDASLSYLLLPKSKVFSPYFGLGGQIGWIVATNSTPDTITPSNNNNDDSDIISRINTSSAIWRVGMRILLYSQSTTKITLNVDLKQSLPALKGRGVRIINFMIGIAI